MYRSRRGKPATRQRALTTWVPGALIVALNSRPVLAVYVRNFIAANGVRRGNLFPCAACRLPRRRAPVCTWYLPTAAHTFKLFRLAIMFCHVGLLELSRTNLLPPRRFRCREQGTQPHGNQPRLRHVPELSWLMTLPRHVCPNLRPRGWGLFFRFDGPGANAGGGPPQQTLQLEGLRIAISSIKDLLVARRCCPRGNYPRPGCR